MVEQHVANLTEAWYDIVHATSGTSLTADETRCIVERLARRTLALLEPGKDRREQAVDALARRILSLRLPDPAVGRMQQVLLEELSRGEPRAKDPSPVAALIGDLTSSLLRQRETHLRREQAETERRLRRSRAALESCVTAVALWTPEGEIIYVNSAFLTLWNYGHAEDVIGRHVSTLWTDDPPFSAIQDSIQAADGWIGKLPAVQRDGNTFSVMLAACLVEGEDAVPFSVGSFIDITHREQLSAMLWRRVDRLRALRRVDRGILAARNPEEIAQAALEHVGQLIPCQRASVTLFGLDDERAQFLSALPRHAYAPEMEDGMQVSGFDEALERLEEGQVHVIKDVRQLPVPESTRRRLARRQAHTLAVVPLRREGNLMGALNLAFHDPEDLTDGHVAIAQEVADSLAVAIHHAQLDQAIARHREQLQDLTARLAQADEAERRLLARALHDQIGQQLTALGINLNVIKARLDAEQVPGLTSRLDDSLQLLKETTERVRCVIADLRPPMLDDYGLLATLRWCGQQLKSRMDVKVAVEGEEPEPRLDSAVEDTLVRITQEALTNVAKHAQASRVTISLTEEGEGVRLEIADDGVGCEREELSPSAEGSWGMITMRERAEAVGGHCRVESEPGEGARVVVEVER